MQKSNRITKIQSKASKKIEITYLLTKFLIYDISVKKSMELAFYMFELYFCS